MFRDREEALRQLEAQLREAEEEEEYEEEEEEYEEECEEDDGDDLPPEVYESYAANCRAYNSDNTDTDLESYSEAVQAGADRKLNRWLAAGMVVLALLVVAIAAYFVAKQGGYLEWRP